MPDEEFIKLFKKDGLDVNTVIDSTNTTVLQEACRRRGRYELAQFLIKNGANVNTITNEGSGYTARTPLQSALQMKHEKLALLLLENGADVNTVNGEKETILHQAIRNMRPSDYYKGDDGIRNPKLILDEILKKNVNLNVGDKNGDSPLYYACRYCDLDTIKKLVEKGADVNFFGKYGLPPLFQAIEYRKADAVKFLLDNGAKINPQQPHKTSVGGLSDWPTPMQTAVGVYHLIGSKNWKPDPDMIKLLHEKGADINQKGTFDSTPLHVAAERGDLDIVKLLIELGADPSIKTFSGKTAEDFAREKNNSEIVAFLQLNKKP